MSELEALRRTIFARLSELPTEAVLATISERGAEARVVMLRLFDPHDAVLSIYTDAATPKLRQIASNPRGSLLLRDTALETQLRLRVELSRRATDSSAFDCLSPQAQQNYGTVPLPGTPIAAPNAYLRVPDHSRFAIIEARIDEIDFVDLSAEPHRRASFWRQGPDWHAEWLAP